MPPKTRVVYVFDDLSPSHEAQKPVGFEVIPLSAYATFLKKLIAEGWTVFDSSPSDAFRGFLIVIFTYESASSEDY